MPRLYVSPEELAAAGGDGGVLVLAGEPHRHLVRVLRLAAGDRVILFDGRGAEIEATIRRAGARAAELALGARRLRPPPAAAPPVTLLQGLPRADRMDLVVQKATELGVARIVPVRAARSVPDQTARIERWQRIAREAARQSGRADVPDVAAIAAIADAVAEAAANAEPALRIALWEDATDAPPLRRAVAAAGATVASVALLVGPEGGLDAAEIARATAAGFTTATLGPRILRTETAAIAALALTQGLLGALD